MNTSSSLTVGEMLEGLARETLLDFEALCHKGFYPPGATLFAAGEACSGIFWVISGQVSVSVSDGSSPSTISHLAQAGEILGLKAALCDEAYGTTARAEGPSEVTFVNRADFSDFLRRNSHATFLIVQRLSDRLGIALDQLRSALTSSPSQRPN